MLYFHCINYSHSSSSTHQLHIHTAPSIVFLCKLIISLLQVHECNIQFLLFLSIFLNQLIYLLNPLCSSATCSFLLSITLLINTFHIFIQVYSKYVFLYNQHNLLCHLSLCIPGRYTLSSIPPVQHQTTYIPPILCRKPNNSLYSRPNLSVTQPQFLLSLSWLHPQLL